MDKVHILILIYLIISAILTISITSVGYKKHDRPVTLFEVLFILLVSPCWCVGTMIVTFIGSLIKSLKKAIGKPVAVKPTDEMTYCLVTIIRPSQTLKILYTDWETAETAISEYKESYQNDIEVGDTKLSCSTVSSTEVLKLVGTDVLIDLFINKVGML